MEVAIVDDRGQVLIDTLVNPQQPIPWRAQSIHGISDDMVRGKPTLKTLMPEIIEIITNEEVVIYNANFDAPFFPGELRQARAISCAMRRYAAHHGGPWRKLDEACRQVGHKWSGEAHRALADALACRSVWRWLNAR